MTGEVDRAALIGLLKELAAMQCGLGNKGVVVLLGESTAAVQGTCDDADGLELGARVTNRIFVDGKCLCEELVADFLESGLVCNFTTHHKQPQCEIGAAGIYSLVQVVDALVHEPVEGRGL